MSKFFCNGADAECSCPILCGDCSSADWTGGTEIITNADHIRSMTDDELAVFLECFGGCHYCPEYETAPWDEHGILDCDGDCEQHLLEWLKQPYKEGI